MNKTAKNSMIYLSGAVITGILSFISTLVLTRVFSQKVYAMHGLLANFHTIFTMIVSFGYDSAYMRFYHKQPFTGKRYLAECLKVPAVLFLLSALLLVEPGQHIITFLFEERLARHVVLLLIVYFFFSSISRFSLLTARMEERAGNFVISNFVGKVGFLGILAIVFFVVGSVSFDWVIISHAIAAVMATMINLVVYKKIWNRKNVESEAFRNIELLKYGFPIMVNSALTLSAPLVEKLIIKELAGWDILSIYTAASIFQTVVLLLVATITNIWTPLVYKMCEDEKKFKPVLHNFGMVATILMALGTSMCILLRRWLVLLLDEKYFSVYIIAPVIFLSACFNLFFVIYSVGINIKKKTWHLVIAPILQLITSVALCYTLIPKMGLVGVGLAVFISLNINRFYTIIVGLKLYGTGTSEAKMYIIAALSTVAAILSLYYTELLSDIIMSSTLIAVSALVMNKEILVTVKNVLGLLKKSKMEKNHE